MAGNWLPEREDREYLASHPDMPMAFRSFQRPAEVHADWHRAENQKRLGSCQGTELSSCGERLVYVQKRKIVQLSKIFAYLGTQRIDGLLGADQGSTISGGAKLLVGSGICEEALAQYPDAYPSQALRNSILSAANYADAANFKAKSSCAMTDSAEDACNFIGGGGAISFGILWYDGFLPADRIVRRYAPPPGTRSGHAQCALGYWSDCGLEGWNSWADGKYRITPEAWHQIVRHPSTAVVGLMGNEGEPVDWLNNSPWDFKG